MESKKGIVVAVIGGGQCSAEEAEMAEIVGRELAKRGAIVICGGLGGIMEAVCRGASSEGGLTIGILPGDDPKEANPYVQIPIVTGLGHARNVAVVRSAQVVIAIDGDYGTLSEIAFALKYGLPVVGLNTWFLSRNKPEKDQIIRAATPIEAVEKALSLAKGTK